MNTPGLRFVLAGIVSLLVQGCYGPRVEGFPPAWEPGGIAATVHLANDSLRAEVLAVEEDALLVLVDPSPGHGSSGQLVRIPLTRVRDARFDNAGEADHSFWRYLGYGPGSENMEPYQVAGWLLAADPAVRSHLRLLSRYPQGVSEELLVRLEGVYGEIETLDPGGGK